MTVLPPSEEWSVPLWIVTHADLHRTAKVQAFLAHVKAGQGKDGAAKSRGVKAGPPPGTPGPAGPDGGDGHRPAPPG